MIVFQREALHWGELSLLDYNFKTSSEPVEQSDYISYKCGNFLVLLSP